ncbi:MAG: RagB/SusD family nutrient uptake outer membrane protein [Bacteroidota bacterium]
MKKTLHIQACLLLIAFGLLNSCSDAFLDVKPNGALDASVLATEEGIDALLIGAYAMLDGVSGNGFGWEAASSNWVFGSIRGMEANKGTDSGDQPDINPLQNYSEATTNPYINIKWRSFYEGISRANSVIPVVTTALEEGTITQEQADLFLKQARAIRGHLHAEAHKMYDLIPYVDENTDLATVTNTVDVRELILADLTEGTTLPDNMGQIGRFNGTVCKVLKAKALMQMNGNYEEAKALLQDVANSGTKPDGSAIGLSTTFGEIFDAENRNGIESVYTVQYSVNDGSGGWNGGWGEVLNFPYKSGESPGGCCGFFQPTQEFVNSFRTDGGLPLLDNSYNDDPVLNDQGLAADDASYVEDPGPLDPRLDWTVGRRGIPYWDWGDHTGQDWIRDQSYAGPFSPKKQVYKQAQEGALTEVGNWTSGYTANGYRMIRYADVLLLLAECQAETGDLGGALENVNAIRTRAANPDGFVTEEDGVTPAANYVINTYDSFADKDMALKAIQMERKLELGMEGHRFFDLKRWGNAQAEINRILSYEKPLRSALYNSGTTFGTEDIAFPIPQRQIDLSSGNLSQNR